MNLNEMPDHAGEWLRGLGPEHDIVVSSRVRLARNLAGYLFVNRATRRERYDAMMRVRSQIMEASLADSLLWVDLNEASDIDRQLLVERHLISRQHAKGGEDFPRAVALDSEEMFAIMVNEEDHLRVQVLRSGMQLEEAFTQANAIDDTLEESLDFAFDERWGYLTACPTNVGTGIRISVMLHLPALKLTGEIEKVRKAARDTNLAVRGLFGEGSEALGDLYQVSNQTTLGRTERELLTDFQRSIVPEIIAYEKQARQALLSQRRPQVEDKVWRAWGILSQARLLGTDEALQYLSHLRLGINLGLIKQIDMRVLNELFLLTQPAHLQRIEGNRLKQFERREARARLVRERIVAK